MCLEYINTNRSIIIDSTGVIIDKHYNEDKHFIVSDKVNESLNWNILEQKLSADLLVSSIIPISENNNGTFWPNLSRQYLRSIIRYCYFNKISSVNDLLDICNLPYLEIESLVKFIPGNEIDYKLFDTGEKTLNNVRLVLLSYLNNFESKFTNNANFKILDWLRFTDFNKSIIFVDLRNLNLCDKRSFIPNNSYVFLANLIYLWRFYHYTSIDLIFNCPNILEYLLPGFDISESLNSDSEDMVNVINL